MKKCLSVVILLAFALCIPAYAAQRLSILITTMAAPANTNSAPVSATKMAIGQTMVTIEPAAQGIPEECILDIVEDNPDSGNIIIYEWGGTGAEAALEFCKYSIDRAVSPE